MSFRFRLILLVLLFASLSHRTEAQDHYLDLNKNGKKDIYEDSSKSIDERLEYLMSLMTLKEKTDQLRSWTYLNIDTWDPEKLALGHLGHITHNVDAEQAVKRINQAQHKQIEKTRLGIPLIIFEEALHGLKTVKATSFPQAICLASSWNIELMEKVSKAIALETKSRGIKQVLSPVVDLGRDPRWRRAQETYGEDAFLVSEMTVAFCKSFEDLGIITTPKHFVANWGEGGRDSWATYLSERGLEEMYFKPYKACIKRAGSRCIMPAYHTLDGVPCSMNPWLLTEKARKEWGFKGFYGTDFNALEVAEDLHRVSDNPAEIAALAINAGLDVEWPKAKYYGEGLNIAINKGWVKESTINDAARRILKIKFEIGLFDNPYGDAEEAVKINDCAKHRKLAQEVAKQGIILLKNSDTTLPLKSEKINTLLVVGQPAQNVNLGNYSGTDMKKTSLMEALKFKYPKMKILFHPGVQSSPTDFSVVSSGLFTAKPNVKIFKNNSFQGKPYVIEERNKPLFFRSHGGNWGSPTPDTRWNNKSMLVTASFKPNISFKVLLKAEATGKMNLYINEEEVLNNLGTKGKKTGFFDDAIGQIGVASDLGNPEYKTDYKFEQGKTYQIRIEYIHPDVAYMQMSLSWDQNYGFKEDLKELNKLAEKSDVIIALPDGIVEGEFKDRSSIRYPEAEEKMIKQLATHGKPTVVVMVNGAAMAVSSWESKVSAIIEQWYAGEESGTALANILFGKVNPSGKLPVTFPQSDGQLPLNYDFKPIGRGTGFQDPLGGKPQYPFGYGLSYTSFRYSDLKLSKKTINKGEGLTVSCTISNSGYVAGSEIVQLYLHDQYSSVARPIRELKGFKKIHLNPNESKIVELELNSEELSILDRDMNFTMEPGFLEVWIGASSEDIRLIGRFSIIDN